MEEFNKISDIYTELDSIVSIIGILGIENIKVEWLLESLNRCSDFLKKVDR